MGRLPRRSDPELAVRLRRHMHHLGWNGTAAAAALGVDKATLSRTLRAGAFSPSLQKRVAALIETPSPHGTEELLRESLHKLSLADELRREAEVMISRALDLARQNH